MKIWLSDFKKMIAEDLEAIKLAAETPSLCEYVITHEKKKRKGMLIKSSFFFGAALESDGPWRAWTLNCVSAKSISTLYKLALFLKVLKGLGGEQTGRLGSVRTRWDC